MLKQGSIVKSISGRDSGRFYLVVKTEANYAFIVDGKVRKLTSPKKKSVKHLCPTNTVLEYTCITSDKHLKQMLSPWNKQVSASEGGNLNV